MYKSDECHRISQKTGSKKGLVPKLKKVGNFMYQIKCSSRFCTKATLGRASTCLG